MHFLIGSFLFQIYFYPTSFLAHLVIGAGAGIFVVFFLREDMKDIIIAIFNFTDKIYSKFFTHQKEKHKEHFKFSFLNLIYHWFYR